MNNASPERDYLKSLTLLYVEDEELTREIFSEFLTRLVGVLITAKNGAEGLDAYREHCPDIVITDIQMPVMDGMTMMQEIRTLDTFKSVPIFIMTAFDQVDYLKRSIPLGVCEYVFKPLDPDKFTESLLSCSRRLLEEKKLRQAQDEVVMSRDIYADLFQFAPIAYFAFDFQGVIREANHSGRHLLGIEHHLLAGKPFSSFAVNDEGKEVIAQHFESVLRREGMQKCDIRLTGSDGTVVFGQLQSVVVGSGKKEDMCILSSVVDGTAGELMKKEIQGALEYAENIVETVREPLVVLNSDLKILTANHSFYDTFKVTPEDTIGNFIYDVGNRQWDIPKLRVLVEEILPLQTVINGYEVEHDFPGIGHKIILLNARQIFREKIGSHLILLAMDDITARKQIESVLQENQEQLQTFNDQLENRIAEEVGKNREKDILLLHQDKMSSIGQLAAGVAHEINNPMAFIASNLVTLKSYVESLSQFHQLFQGLLEKNGTVQELLVLEEATRKLDIAFILEDISPLIAESSEGATRVKQIVHDLKGFARTDESSFELADLNDCVRSTVNIVRNEIKYVAELDLQLGDIPQISCSSNQLSQVIINLLVNAAHSIDSHGSITVTTRQVDDTVVLSVRDTGKGMTEEVRKRVFEPFYTTKEVGKGTGLGLSISYSIIKKHGGEILVESEPGKGTIFSVTLPIHERQENPA
ncbi:MAG TPA: response regulator [Desulfuromonadales bacterium]|nr:response regulator [Desulfuromonadales bacterium]